MGLIFGYPDYMIYLIFGEYIALAVGLLVYFALYRWRKIYQAHFYIKTGGGNTCASYTKIGQKNFKATDDFIMFKGRGFHVDLDKGAFTDNNKTVLSYVYDGDGVNGSARLWFGGFQLVGDTKRIYETCNNVVDSKLARSVKGVDSLIWVLLICMVVVAVLAFLVGNLAPDLFVKSAEVASSVK